MLDPSKMKILNENEEGHHELAKDPTEVLDLSKRLHKQLLRIKGNFLKDDGTVQYKIMRTDQDFLEFKQQCSALKFVQLSSLHEIEKKAFFINVYNTLTIHALAQNVEDEKSVLELDKFWQMYAYRIGSMTFSLDDIEHGVLRCNKLHPTYKEYFFKEGDPRREFVMKELDPRIHFALNCGAKSCPPIRIFSSKNLDAALDLAAENVCRDFEIDVENKEVRLSKILDWYGQDFGEDDNELVGRILPYFTKEQKRQFVELKGNFKIVFMEYDWSIH